MLIITVMKFEETQEQFIFQTISDFTSNVYQIEIDKQELIDALKLVMEACLYSLVKNIRCWIVL